MPPIHGLDHQLPHGLPRHIPPPRALSLDETMDVVAPSMARYVLVSMLFLVILTLPSGLTFNWGIPVAYVYVAGRLPPPALWVMYFGGVWYVLATNEASTIEESLMFARSWTIVYDTIYACQDREDDRKVGVKSTALLFGEHVREILGVMVAILLSCLIYSGFALGQGIGFATLSVGGTFLHTTWQLATWDEANLKDHRAKFEVRFSVSRI